MGQVSLISIDGLLLVKTGDRVVELILKACEKNAILVAENDIFVIAQKIISKSEGAIIDLKSVTPSARALELANLSGRDARLCQVYLDESMEVLRVKGRTIVTKHRLGFECSAAGVDMSNVAPHRDEIVVLLPKDPDVSARAIRDHIRLVTGKTVAVIINDSFGRKDRDGSIGTAIGIAGIRHLEQREQADLYGNASFSRVALVDELAAAASILMGQADERCPVILIRGVRFTLDENAEIRKLLFL
jgi:coenzyme F420-0:L-glutamate ligase/coenzyme F420-1:gamma-L-glutamate ligase